MANSWSIRHASHAASKPLQKLPRLSPERAVRTEWASPTSRGDDHISAFIDVGDLVLWREGSWLVDGVEVGDAPPVLRLGLVTAIQVVWTHNCEIGVIYADFVAPPTSAAGATRVVEDSPSPSGTQFGPEQLVAMLGSLHCVGDYGGARAFELSEPWNYITQRANLTFLAAFCSISPKPEN